MIGQSFLISLVVRYLLKMGLPWLEDWSEEKKNLVKDWVYSQVPGKWADEIAWSAVEGLWDTILSVAKGELERKGFVSIESGSPEAWPSLASALSKIEESLAS